MNLAEYTSSAYEVTLTTQSIDSTSSLSYGTESNYTFTSSESDSGTYWISRLQDSRSVSSSTSFSTNITSSVESFTASSGTGILTTATTVESSHTYRGKTSWQDTYTEVWSRSMVSLSFSHTGITSIVSVSSYGDYTYRTTTYSNKTRIDTTVVSTIYRTVANKNSEVVSVSQTNSWLRTLGSYSTTVDIECIISKGVASSLIYLETGSTIQAGNKYYNTSVTSLTSLEAERTSGTLYNSTNIRTWTQSTCIQDTIPAESIRFTSLWLNTFTDWDEEEYTYLSTSSTTTVESTSSVSYMSVTLFPKEYVYSISSSTHSYIHEWISYTIESTTGPLYLGSQTLSIISQSSTTTFLSETYSRSWVDMEGNWSISEALPQVVRVGPFVQNQSMGNYIYNTFSVNSTGGIVATTAMAHAIYQTSAYSVESWEIRGTSYFSSTLYSSSTGSTSSWFSSTTYTGEFGIHSLSTTLSNYESVVSTSSTSSSNAALINAVGMEMPRTTYTEFAGSGFTTIP